MSDTVAYTARKKRLATLWSSVAQSLAFGRLGRLGRPCRNLPTHLMRKKSWVNSVHFSDIDLLDLGDCICQLAILGSTSVHMTVTLGPLHGKWPWACWGAKCFYKPYGHLRLAVTRSHNAGPCSPAKKVRRGMAGASYLSLWLILVLIV